MVSGEKYNQLEYLESSVEAFWGRRGILAQPAFYYVFFCTTFDAIWFTNAEGNAEGKW